MPDRSKHLLLRSLLVIAGLIVNFKNTVNKSADTISDSGEIKCPFCAELIKKDAKLCKHCKSSILEVPATISPTITDSVERINPIVDSNDESPAATILPIPRQASTIDRSSLNKSYSEEFNSSLGEVQIKNALAYELDKLTEGFHPESLMGFKGKTVVTEATLSNIGGKKWKVKIDFAEKSRYWLISKIIIPVLVICLIAGLVELFLIILVCWPVIIILMNVIILDDATTKIKPAVEAFKNSIHNIQSNPENTSSILCSLKLISVGDRVDEVTILVT